MPLRGSLRYSQRSGHLQTRFARTKHPPESASPLSPTGDDTSGPAKPVSAVSLVGASLRLPSPRLLVRCAHLAGVGVASFLYASLLSRARHAVPLHPSKTAAEPQTSSFRAQSRNPCLPALQLGCCDYAQHDDMCRAPLPPSPTPFPVFPHSSLLTPHSSPLTPHSSPLIPHPSLLTPHSSPLTPHPYDLTPQPSANGCAVRAIAFRPPGWGPGSAGIGRAGFWGRLLRRGWIRPRSSG